MMATKGARSSFCLNITSCYNKKLVLKKEAKAADTGIRGDRNCLKTS